LFLPNDEEHCPSGEVLRCAASSGEENVMKKLLLISAAAAALVSTGAFAQTTVVTTTGTGHSGAVQIEPEYRTKIRSYVTEHKIRPVETREKIVVGSPVPRDVELEAVPTEWGPSLTRYRYVYSGERVMLVDPETRAVIQEVE
jgi:mRNA-degrading endonuclease toxin of MazEF toxin-antitoxin module